MTSSPVSMRLALIVMLALSVGSLAVGAERETIPEAAEAALAPAAPVPAPVVAFEASAGRMLPADAVLLATLAAPPTPAVVAAGAMLLQGGGPPQPQLRYYALDALGSVRVTFDAAGNVIGRADYEPFGAAVAASTTGTQSRQQFTGQDRDGEVGVDYFGARLYLPAHGRLPSVDPLYTGAVEEPQRWNRYSYALNEPLLYIDPDGRCATKSPGVTFYTCTEGQAPAPMTTPSAGQPSLLGNGSGFTDSNSYFLLQYGEIPNFGSQTIASILHTTLDVAGVAVPGIGDVLDLVNAGIYLAEGDITSAGIAAASAAPVVGVAATAGKWGKHVAKGVTNAVPTTVARVVPANIAATTLGRPGTADVFVTAADDIRGLGAAEIAKRLAIPVSSSGYRVFEFPVGPGLASPIGRGDPGFVGFGRTAGGAREFVVLNGPVPQNAKSRIVR